MELIHPVRRRGSLASTGARTVMVTGLSESADAEYLTSQTDFLQKFLISENAVPIEPKAPYDFDCKPFTTCKHPPPFTTAGKYVIPESVAIVRGQPKGCLTLIEKEQALLNDLKDAVARTEKEKDLKKLPIKSGLCFGWCTCCGSNLIEKLESELSNVRAKLRAALSDVPNQPPVGVVFFSFHEPKQATRFVYEYNDAMYNYPTRAHIAGPRQSLIWSNVVSHPQQLRTRRRIGLWSYGPLALAFGIPIGVLSSVDSIEAINDSTESWVGGLSSLERGILAAFLPVLMISIITALLLPRLVRLYVRLLGELKKQVATKMVLLMCFIFLMIVGIVSPAVVDGVLQQVQLLVANPSAATALRVVEGISSPQNSFFAVSLIMSGCIGSALRLFDIVEVFLSIIKIPFLGRRQDSYEKILGPRKFDYAFETARHLYFFAIAMLFHGTTPFLLPFATLYFLFMYLAERSVCLDSRRPDPDPIVDLPHVSLILRIIIYVHRIGLLNATLLLGVKQSWIGMSIALAVGLLTSFMTARTANSLHGIIKITSRRVADYQRRFPRIPVLPSETTVFESSRAPQPFQSWPSNSDGTLDPLILHPYRDWYFPPHQCHSINDEAVQKIHATDYCVEKTWIGNPYIANIPDKTRRSMYEARYNCNAERAAQICNISPHGVNPYVEESTDLKNDSFVHVFKQSDHNSKSHSYVNDPFTLVVPNMSVPASAKETRENSRASSPRVPPQPTVQVVVTSDGVIGTAPVTPPLSHKQTPEPHRPHPDPNLSYAVDMANSVVPMPTSNFSTAVNDPSPTDVSHLSLPVFAANDNSQHRSHNSLGNPHSSTSRAQQATVQVVVTSDGVIGTTPVPLQLSPDHGSMSHQSAPAHSAHLAAGNDPVTDVSHLSLLTAATRDNSHRATQNSLGLPSCNTKTSQVSPSRAQQPTLQVVVTNDGTIGTVPVTPPPISHAEIAEPHETMNRNTNTDPNMSSVPFAVRAQPSPAEAAQHNDDYAFVSTAAIMTEECWHSEPSSTPGLWRSSANF